MRSGPKDFLVVRLERLCVGFVVGSWAVVVGFRKDVVSDAPLEKGKEIVTIQQAKKKRYQLAVGNRGREEGDLAVARSRTLVKRGSAGESYQLAAKAKQSIVGANFCVVNLHGVGFLAVG